MKYLFINILSAILAAGSAANAARADEPGTFTILFENDWFDNSDRHYSSGVQLAWTTAPEDSPGWGVAAARFLPFFAQSGEVRTTYAVGQNIYTPSSISIANPPLTDRPYAGFLYGSIGLSDRTDHRLDQLQLQLGVVGPSALAEETQTWVHSVFGGAKPLGWNTQLHDEPAVQLIYERSYRVFASRYERGVNVDLEPHFGAAVGTVYDYVNAGALARVGFNLPDDYGPLRIEPGLPGSNFFRPAASFGAYLFAGVDGRAIGRNIFLDGNTWRRSRSVDKKILVGDIQLGAALVFKTFRVVFTHVIRSKEFTTQDRTDRFGAVSLSFRF
jgi:lipid A 3-O-deacylase